MEPWREDLYDTLYHHGVKGMHWGVRRYRNTDGSLTAAGRRRYGVGPSTSGSSRSDRKVKKYKDVKKEAKAATKEAKVAKKEAEEALAALRKQQALQPKKEPSKAPQDKNHKDMSNEELKKVVERLELEKRYNELKNPPPPAQKSRVEKLAKTVGDLSKIATGVGVIAKLFQKDKKSDDGKKDKAADKKKTDDDDDSDSERSSESKSSSSESKSSAASAFKSAASSAFKAAAKAATSRRSSSDYDDYDDYDGSSSSRKSEDRSYLLKKKLGLSSGDSSSSSGSSTLSTAFNAAASAYRHYTESRSSSSDSSWNPPWNSSFVDTASGILSKTYNSMQNSYPALPPAMNSYLALPAPDDRRR